MTTEQENKLSPSFSHDSDVARPSTTDMKPQSLWKNLRRHPKAVGYCVALTSGILLWGYDMAMTGNLAGLPAFQ